MLLAPAVGRRATIRSSACSRCSAATVRASSTPTARYGCPIGSLALEIHEPDPPVRVALAENFNAWTDALAECLEAAGPRLPGKLDRRELAAFVLTVMEGGVMQARTHRDVSYFDGSMRQLRALLRPA